MGHSFIDFDGKHIEYKDWHIELLTRCICIEALNAMPWSSHLEELFSIWKTDEALWGNGCIDLKLDQFIVNDDVCNELLRIVEWAKSRIQSFNGIVPAQYLNQISDPQPGEFRDIPGRVVQLFFEGFKILLTRNIRVVEWDYIHKRIAPSIKVQSIRSDGIHALVAAEELSRVVHEEAVLALMYLLHTHDMRLKGAILEDRPGIDYVTAVSRNRAAELIASVWPNQSDPDRTNPDFWLNLYQLKMTPERINDPYETGQMIAAVKEWILHGQFVAEFIVREKTC